jgi:hypothetical protein
MLQSKHEEAAAPHASQPIPTIRESLCFQALKISPS